MTYETGLRESLTAPLWHAIYETHVAHIRNPIRSKTSVALAFVQAKEKRNEHPCHWHGQNSAYVCLPSVFLAQWRELQPSKLSVGGSSPPEYVVRV